MHTLIFSTELERSRAFAAAYAKASPTPPDPSPSPVRLPGDATGGASDPRD